ncbi:MAG: flagellar assembly peptidoglycan hydrolase FlgJ [Nevskia sp.]|nr:flagellar assembly peptidoglycan hydrolase FlgJ [Nevskia sp.]
MSIPRANAATAEVATDFSQFASLRAAAKRNDPQVLRKAAQQFEALFTQMLLKTSRQTQFGDDLTGEQGDMYKDMFDQQMALHLSTSGKGLGLADMLVRQLSGLHGGAGTSAPQGTIAAGAASGSSVASSAASSTASAAGAIAGSALSVAAPPSTTTDAAGNWKPKSAQEFVDAIRPHAEKAAAELGVPARALIAQAALETGWGQHLGKTQDGASSLNLFGVKAQAGWSGTSQTQQTAEFQNGQWTTEQASFRSYNSIGSAFDDYVKFLKDNPRYADALRSGNVQGFAHGLQKAGYATDPHYAQKLLKVAYGTQMTGAYGTPSVVTA